MIRLPLIALFAAAAFSQAAFSQTAGARQVYVLPMAGGLDQYLAGQLTREHVMTVVADPKAADVVLTDRLGEAFEAKMAKIHPRDEDEDDDSPSHPAFRSAGTSGTFFLVDAKSRQVLWSGYERRPRNISSDSLNREAAQVVKKLKEKLGN